MKQYLSLAIIGVAFLVNGVSFGEEFECPYSGPKVGTTIKFFDRTDVQGRLSTDTFR